MPTSVSGPFVLPSDEREDSGIGESAAVHSGTGDGPPLRVVLYQPEIPQNTGNIARTCAATHTPLHLVEPLGFRITDKYLKRAGLDYWPHVRLHVHPDWNALLEALSGSRLVYFSAHARQSFFDFEFRRGDCLVFGPESRGLPPELVEGACDRCLQIPVDRERVRSLNLSTVVGIALFEGLRQTMVSDVGGIARTVAGPP